MKSVGHKRVGVFCGANTGRNPAFALAAKTLGRAIARKNWVVVYGGASIGLMGLMANAALDAGGDVIGVIPNFLMQREFRHLGLTELHIVRTMQERKAKIAQLSDAFIALPGGIGALVDVGTLGYLGSHEKSYGVLDIAGYYSPILRFLAGAAQDGFASRRTRAMLHVEKDVDALLAKLA